MQIDPIVGSQLCQVFLLQVDPIIKILHRPSLSRFMIDGKAYLDYPESHPSIEALRAAVCYAAVSSLTKQRCYDMLGADQPTLAMEYQEISEAAIERSGLVTSEDITVLQAFIIYLVSL